MLELEFVEKPLPAIEVAQIVGTISTIGEIAGVIGPMFERLAAALTALGVPLGGPNLSWYYPTEDGLRIGAAFPVQPGAATRIVTAGIEVETLRPVAHAVTTRHHGGMDTIGESWQALVRHVEAKGYQSMGTCREVYLRMPLDGDPATWITELQQPVF